MFLQSVVDACDSFMLRRSPRRVLQRALRRGQEAKAMAEFTRVRNGRCLLDEVQPSLPLDTSEKTDGNSPMHYAALHVFEPLLGQLIERGGTPMCVNVERRTPIHLCVSLPDRSARRAAMLRTLLAWQEPALPGFDDGCEPIRAQASVHAVDADGNSALSLASRTGLEECVMVLLDRGAMLSLVNYAGLSASDLASSARMAEMLEQRLVFEIDVPAPQQLEALSAAVAAAELEAFSAHPTTPAEAAEDRASRVAEVASMIGSDVATAARVLACFGWRPSSVMGGFLESPQAIWTIACLDKLPRSANWAVTENGRLVEVPRSAEAAAVAGGAEAGAAAVDEATPDDAATDEATPNDAATGDATAEGDDADAATATAGAAVSATASAAVADTDTDTDTDMADAPPPPPPPECPVCGSTDPLTSVASCEHAMCSDCWEGHSGVYAREKGALGAVPCFGLDCPAHADLALLAPVLPAPLAATLARQALEAFVDRAVDFVWCQHPGCGEMVRYRWPDDLFVPLTAAGAAAAAGEAETKDGGADTDDDDDDDEASREPGWYRRKVAIKADKVAVDAAEAAAAAACRAAQAVPPGVAACAAGHSMCYACLEAPHAPSTCAALGAWEQRLRDELKAAGKAEDGGVGADEAVGNRLWMAANTKPCPRCKARMEKTEGCNHMTCPKCAHEFCWICQRDWSLHSSATGGYFRCNVFLSEADKEESVAFTGTYIGRGSAAEDARAMAEAARETARFIHHYSRWGAHGASAELETALRDPAVARLRRLARAAEEGEAAAAGAILEAAFGELLATRAALRASYVYAFAEFAPEKLSPEAQPPLRKARARAPPNGHSDASAGAARRQLAALLQRQRSFEQVQGDLELVAEALSEMIARKTRLRSTLDRVADTTLSAAKLRLEMRGVGLRGGAASRNSRAALATAAAAAAHKAAADRRLRYAADTAVRAAGAEEKAAAAPPRTRQGLRRAGNFSSRTRRRGDGGGGGGGSAEEVERMFAAAGLGPLGGGDGDGDDGEAAARLREETALTQAILMSLAGGLQPSAAPPPPPPPPAAEPLGPPPPAPAPAAYEDQALLLADMGFDDARSVRSALRIARGNVERAIALLVMPPPAVAGGAGGPT